VLARFVFTIFGVHFSFEVMPLGEILMVFSLLAMFIGSLVAMFQHNVKRMLAYSSVAQIGYMALGMSFASVNGLTGGIVHLFNHAAMKGALFLALAGVFYRLGSVDLDSLRGMGRRMPLTMAAFVTAGLSLVGIPLTVGFVSKWYLVVAAIERGLWPVAVMVLVSSLLALIYIWRVVEVAYFREPDINATAVTEAPAALLVPTLVLAAACVYFGIDTDMTVGVARMAAESLLGGGS
jgi:multicomponent Na+:H+ antiporter subunit D